ncbi:5'-adenylylsulfate reductase-like 5 [Malania oleifera]|uniref:5'-adenylylsulfate reductase-like 5 n=1 Tax=Malania oleifera TaxID=397392 RepID=UPI0025ADCDDC|nr:5'-adenylylsulfate reductase-like 5 [Malania oleifera]
MAASIKYLAWFCMFATASSIRFVSSASSLATCDPLSNPVLYNLQLQCPLSISPSSPIEMDGESLDRALAFSSRNVYTAVLFYASWCPFSRDMRSKFDMLGSIFPQITHLAVEQSSAMPSVFSRHGIHSVPSLLIVNDGASVRFNGQRNLDSLMCFYVKTTGLGPVGYWAEGIPNLYDSRKEVVWPMNMSSMKEFAIKEPYIVFSLLFLVLRAILHFIPGILSRLTALWVSYLPHPNLGIFGEASQFVGRILHLIDVKRVLSKLKLCKTRNFHDRARSARVWASSLASVSLGKTRASPLGIS